MAPGLCGQAPLESKPFVPLQGQGRNEVQLSSQLVTAQEALPVVHAPEKSSSPGLGTVGVVAKPAFDFPATAQTSPETPTIKVWLCRSYCGAPTASRRSDCHHGDQAWSERYAVPHTPACRKLYGNASGQSGRLLARSDVPG